MSSDEGLTPSQAEASVPPARRRSSGLVAWLRSRWLILPTSAASAGLHFAGAPYLWLWQDLLLAAGVAAVGVRAAIHQHLRYGNLFPKVMKVEWTLSALLALCLTGLIVTQQGHRTVLAVLLAACFVGLGVFYDLANAVLVALRDIKQIPSAASWVSHRKVCEVRLADVLRHQQGPVTAALDQIVNEPTTDGERTSPVGGTLAGAVLVGFLLYSGTGYAAAQLVPTHSDTTSSTDSDEASGSLHGGTGVGSTVIVRGPVEAARTTYDELCAPAAMQPGTGAPPWAHGPLYRLWFAPGLGVGGYLAGCAERVQRLTDHRGLVYEIGRLNGRVVGVAVSVRFGPTTLYLGRAAERVLALLRRGVVVVGPNATHVAGTQLHLVPTKYGLYATQPSQ